MVWEGGTVRFLPIPIGGGEIPGSTPFAGGDKWMRGDGWISLLEFCSFIFIVLETTVEPDS